MDNRVDVMMNDEEEDDDGLDSGEMEEPAEWTRWWQASSAALRPEPFFSLPSLGGLRATSTLPSLPVLPKPEAVGNVLPVPIPNCPLCKSFCPLATKIFAWLGAMCSLSLLVGSVLGLFMAMKKVVM